MESSAGGADALLSASNKAKCNSELKSLNVGDARVGLKGELGQNFSKKQETTRLLLLLNINFYRSVTFGPLWSLKGGKKSFF